MDEIVLRAMARWPNVPSVYGWLSLDRRGQWRIKGELINNPMFNSYIGRNYLCDAQGRWYFQNGPQRVFVQLEYTPMIARLEGQADSALRFCWHTGRVVESLDGVWVDETGALLIACEGIAALISDRDLESALTLIEEENGASASDTLLEALVDRRAILFFRYRGARYPIDPIRSADTPGRFGFIENPRPAADEPDC